ncbi:MAG TPA: D-glycerate dehydrogenase, partial [Rhodospirillales bacterium]|nr:D-glycerate dehydrogenase [Rhodospirillales bacterium]
VLTEDTADLAMALIIMASRRLGEGERMVRAGDWTGWTPTQLMGNRVSGRSLGIIGMGRIGQALAKRARGFGMSIHYHNRKRLNLKIERELKAKHWESLDGMIANMKIISINTPLTPSTANILNAERLKRMQPSSVLINTSRGGLIDEGALVENLMKGRIAAAALDVFDGEPHVNPKLMDLENVVLLPHLGSATIEGRVAMGDKVILNAKRFIDGHPPPDKLILELP